MEIISGGSAITASLHRCIAASLRLHIVLTGQVQMEMVQRSAPPALHGTYWLGGYWRLLEATGDYWTLLVATHAASRGQRGQKR